MRVLSIDLDYIMGPSIDKYSEIGWDENPSTRWSNFFHISKTKEHELIFDKKNLLWIYSHYLKALEKCSSVSFAYDHDNILYHIKEYDNIDLVNVDHHHDILYPSIFEDEIIVKNMKWNYQKIKNNSSVNEGEWIGWLRAKDKLNSYTWVTNQNAIDDLGEKQIKYFDSLIRKFKIVTRENYDIVNHDFDHIHVCLSPQYMPKIHWHYFSMFVIAYETKTGNKVNLDQVGNSKFETTVRHLNVTNEILY